VGIAEAQAPHVHHEGVWFNKNLTLELNVLGEMDG